MERSIAMDAVSDYYGWAVPSIGAQSSGGRSSRKVLVCAGLGLIVVWGVVGYGWVAVGCVIGVEVVMVGVGEALRCWFLDVVVSTGVSVVGVNRLVAEIAPLGVWVRVVGVEELVVGAVVCGWVASRILFAVGVVGGVGKLVVGFGGVGAVGCK